MSHRPVIGIDASRSYRLPMTGTERYSRRLVEHLLQLDSGEATYRLYFNDSPPDEAVLSNAEVATLPARRLWTHYRLSRELRMNPIDLLFVPSHVLPLFHPPESVVTVHDLGYLYEPEGHTWSDRTQLRLSTKWNAHQASHLIAISEMTRRDLIEHCGVEKSKVSVVRHGIDEQFRPLPEQEVERYRRAARLPERFVLYLGTIQPRKNLVRLITAFERCSAVDPDVHLVIAGKTGWRSEPIMRRVSASPFRERIRMLGYVPDTQLPALYNAASALALVSLYEGFGLPVLEAMACGAPVIMSNRGALPELNGADTIMIDPLDVESISSGLAQAAARRHEADLVECRVQHAGGFRWEDSARATREILLERLGHGSGRHA